MRTHLITVPATIQKGMYSTQFMILYSSDIDIVILEYWAYWTTVLRFFFCSFTRLLY